MFHFLKEVHKVFKKGEIKPAELITFLGEEIQYFNPNVYKSIKTATVIHCELSPFMHALQLLPLPLAGPYGL